jgi:KUP system potassium uptake protein
VPRVEPEQRIKLVPVGAGITRILFHFGFMETPNVMEGLKLACHIEPELRGIDPQKITYYFRRVMVIPSGKASGMCLAT